MPTPIVNRAGFQTVFLAAEGAWENGGLLFPPMNLR